MLSPDDTEEMDVPKSSKASAAQSVSGPGYEGRFGQLEGYPVAFEEFSEGGDFAPLFHGLPDDRCQSPHWGVVLKGRLTVTYADGQDVIEAGEAYYAPAGHTPAAEPGTETVEFSPTAELQKTMAVVMKNAEALGAQA
jgi:hypothetical protein